MLIKKQYFLKRRVINYLIIFESLLIVAITIFSSKLRHIGEELTAANDLKVIALLVLFPVMWLCCLSLFGAWDVTILNNHIDGYRRLMKSSIMTFIVFAASSYLFRIQISRFVILFSLVCGTIFHLLLRWIFLRFSDRLLKRSKFYDQWLVISDDTESNSRARIFAKNQNAQVTLLTVSKSDSSFQNIVQDLEAKLSVKEFDKVVLASTEGISRYQIEHLTWLIQEHNSEFVVFDQLGIIASQNEVKKYSDLNFIGILPPRIEDSQRVVKRIFDLVLVVPSIVILLPMFLIIALLIKIDSRGPIFYTQKRIGQKANLFVFPKFRSMKPGSEAMRLETLGRPDFEMVERYRKDPRVTRLGRFIRRFSLDELPQLWCVLVGTMSLVGPRPILPEEAVQLGVTHFRRQIAKPGLTGIWQVSGRKETTWEERMAFDVKYVQEWSMALDLILVARTFRAIISGKGSY